MTLVKVNNPIAKSLDGLFSDFFNEFPAGLGKSMREDFLSFPPVNIIEKNDHFHLEVSAPGMEKSDFTISLDGNTLTISGNRKEEKTEQDHKMIRREFTCKNFKRSFTVDDKIDAGNINARYENGILVLTLPKKEEVKNANKQIAIS